MKCLGVLWLSLLGSVSAQTTTATLDQTRVAYVGKRVLVQTGVAGCWKQFGVIISIDPNAGAPPKDGQNALGEPIAAPGGDTPITVALKCEDGTTKSGSFLLSLMPMGYKLVEANQNVEADTAAKQVELQRFVGESVYSKNLHNFYSSSSTIADIEGGNRSKLYISAEPGETFRVTAAKAWHHGSDVFGLLKLQSLTVPAKEMFAGYQFSVPNEPAGSLVAEDFHSGIGGCFHKGSEKGPIEVGLPRQALICLWGEPKRINSDSTGLEQFVYEDADGGGDFVYVSNGIIRSFQHQER